MNLNKAVLCLDCQEVFSSNQKKCPTCGRNTPDCSYPIVNWIRPISEANKNILKKAA